MSSVSIKMQGNNSKSIDEISSILQYEINANLIAENKRIFDNVNVILLSF